VLDVCLGILITVTIVQLLIPVDDSYNAALISPNGGAEQTEFAGEPLHLFALPTARRAGERQAQYPRTTDGDRPFLRRIIRPPARPASQQCHTRAIFAAGKATP
jgi:hypothetical protein